MACGRQVPYVLDGCSIVVAGGTPGDAAHPMFPMGMNGASQSIIDARVPAWCRAREPDRESALGRYDGIRRPVVNAVVLAARRGSPVRLVT
ncbi:hypothetical protein ACFXD5_05810 [Streptomyces sp. NPDC059385]|uniref:hypothetical protein n=1 Tax=Streptomyces sp. NPDC059385 TaxID=3346817 RepID=UPI0036BB0C1F